MIKAKYLAIQRCDGIMLDFILVNISMSNGLGTVVYNPAIHKLSWKDVFKLKVDMGFLKV